MKLPELPKEREFDTGQYHLIRAYDDEQMQAYGQACWNAALEDAAIVCMRQQNDLKTRQKYCHAIRSLK